MDGFFCSKNGAPAYCFPKIDNFVDELILEKIRRYDLHINLLDKHSGFSKIKSNTDKQKKVTIEVCGIAIGVLRRYESNN